MFLKFQKCFVDYGTYHLPATNPLCDNGQNTIRVGVLVGEPHMIMSAALSLLL